MKTKMIEPVGDMKLVLRQDNGIYLGREKDGVLDRDMIRIGSTPGICRALSDALKLVAERIEADRAAAAAADTAPDTERNT